MGEQTLGEKVFLLLLLNYNALPLPSQFMCVYLLNDLRPPSPTRCPVPDELGLDSSELVDKSVYVRLLNFSITDIC